MIQPALLGGLFIGVLSALPVVSLANCCCLWIISGGLLAAYLDQSPGRPNSLGRGALDGLLAGVIGAVVWLIVSSVVSTMIAPLERGLVEAVLEGAYDMPPEVRGWLERIRHREASIFAILLGFMFQLFGGMIFATLGGFFGAMFFWRDNVPPALGGPQPPPPIPPQY